MLRCVKNLKQTIVVPLGLKAEFYTQTMPDQSDLKVYLIVGTVKSKSLRKDNLGNNMLNPNLKLKDRQ